MYKLIIFSITSKSSSSAAAAMADDQQHEEPMIYRFYPTEEELISFYLTNQLQNRRPHDLHRVIPVVNVYQHNHPSHLPKLAGELCRGDTEQWFFFVPRQEREAQGGRPSRTTASGYWKATGSPTYVYSSENKVIGVKKTMVFYEGKYSGSTVKKTQWKMNEYRAINIKLEDQHVEEDNTVNAFPVPKLRHELSLCRVYVVSGTTRAFDRRPIGIDDDSMEMQVVNPSEPIRKQLGLGASSSSSSSRNIPVVQTRKAPATTSAASSYLQSLCPSPDDDQMVEDYMPPPQPQHQWERAL